MNAPFSEAQLFRAYEVVFHTLLNGLLVAVAVMLIAALMMILLCCWQLKAQTRRRDREPKVICEDCLENSNNENIRKREARSAERSVDRMNRIHRMPKPGLFHPVYPVNPVQNQFHNHERIRCL